MKKLLSLILTIIITTGIITSLPFTAGAKTVKPKETTYIASGCVYNNTNGKVFANSKGLFSVDKDGNKVQLDAIPVNDYDPDNDYYDYYDYDYTYSFYIRGKRVYYTNGYDHIFSVKMDGTGKKDIGPCFGTMIGGYGTSALTVYTSRTKNGTEAKVYEIKGGKASVLLETGKNVPHLFNGKIYYGNKVFNIDTKKINSFSWKNPQPKVNKQYFYSSKSTMDERLLKVTKTHMYYVNKNNNLVRLDKNGNKKVVANKVTSVLGGNDNKNVIYIKKNSKGVKTIYRQNRKGKNIALTNYNKIYNAFAEEFYYKSLDDVVFDGAFLVNGKVVLYNALEILCVDNKGGAVAKIDNCVDSIFYDIEVCGKTLYYREFECDDIPNSYYRTKTIKWFFFNQYYEKEVFLWKKYFL